jgi:hypothetical protein
MKWNPVRVNRRSASANTQRSALANTRKKKKPEPRSDSIGAEKALGANDFFDRRA